MTDKNSAEMYRRREISPRAHFLEVSLNVSLTFNLLVYIFLLFALYLSHFRSRFLIRFKYCRCRLTLTWILMVWCNNMFIWRLASTFSWAIVVAIVDSSSRSSTKTTGAYTRHRNSIEKRHSAKLKKKPDQPKTKIQNYTSSEHYPICCCCIFFLSFLFFFFSFIPMYSLLF